MHADEVVADAELVRLLVAEQFPQWAALPVAPVRSWGTDHAVHRLGDELCTRMPRTAWATGQAAKEAEWLPRLAPHLPLAVPRHLGAGRPGRGYPFPWAVCTWLPGTDAADGFDDPERAAADLAAFVRALRACPTAGAPTRDPGARGAPLAELDERVRAAVAQLGDRADGRAVLRAWDEAAEAPCAREEAWLHGDLLPGNLLVSGGRLSAVIDFGALGAGDAACDLQPAWNCFTGTARRRYLEELDVDAASLLRGRGWVVYQTASALPYYWNTNPPMVRQASRALAEVLADPLR